RRRFATAPRQIAMSDGRGIGRPEKLAATHRRLRFDRALACAQSRPGAPPRQIANFGLTPKTPRERRGALSLSIASHLPRAIVLHHTDEVAPCWQSCQLFDFPSAPIRMDTAS